MALTLKEQISNSLDTNIKFRLTVHGLNNEYLFLQPRT